MFASWEIVKEVHGVKEIGNVPLKGIDYLLILDNVTETVNDGR